MAAMITGDDDDGRREMETSSRRDNRKTKTKTNTRRNPSVISLAIARTASMPAGISSMDSKELIRGLYKGVILDLDHYKLKFWIDEKLHEHCFMVLARSLQIIWGSTEQYWRWSSYKEDCFGGPVDIDEAILQQVCWLEITGSFPSTMLSPMATYEVVFKLMMTEDADGWHVPVDIGLTLPNGTRHRREENLETKDKEQWCEIQVGEFVATPENVGNIEFSLNEHASHWKRGLAVQGVIFRPKS